MCGCTPSYSIKTDATNYREKLSIEKKDIDFYNGEYIGPDKYCFPPIDNRICKSNNHVQLYKPTKNLKLEDFSISIKDTSGVTSKTVKDMAYLTAAELAEQRGFKTFTVLHSIDTAACNSIYSTNTYGNFSGDMYSGRSYLSKDVICSNIYDIEILLYDDNDDLKKGVLIGSPQFLQPFESLYIGTTPGLYEEYLQRHIDFLEQETKYPKNVNTSGYITKNNAWKTQYDIHGLAGELRKLYSISDKLPYSFTDERERSKKSIDDKNADPIEKFKVTK